MRARIFLEGGGDTADTQARCREGFRKLLKNCGFSGRMPRLCASGGRGGAYEDFKTAHESNAAGDYVAMLIDSEEPMADIEKTWAHLAKHGPGKKPKGAHDVQDRLTRATRLDEKL